MGLYAGGDPRLAGADDIAAIMRPTVATMFDARIRILDPNNMQVTPYDAKTDTGGDAVPSQVWDSGPNGALVQPLRAQTIGDFGGQAVGLVAVRIQAAIPPEIGLRSGLWIRVIDGGSDHESERHTYVIGAGIDSSRRWVTRLTATVTAT